MWFKSKKRAAPIYQDETFRRLFATASGRDRPKGVDKLKKLRPKDPDAVKGWRRWFSAGSKRRSADRASTASRT